MKNACRIALVLSVLTGSARAADAASPRVRAIDKGLTYLTSKQAADGSWERAPGRKSVAVTSLAVLAFLSAGHKPDKGPHGADITRGIRWVMEKQKPNGLLAESNATSMYDHGIATLMLAEASRLSDRTLARDIRPKLEKAVQLIVKAQKVRRYNPRHQGGWRYTSTSFDSDLSVTGWQIPALRAAQKAGFAVPLEAFDRAADFIRRCHHKRMGGFCYQPNTTPTLTCTATAILGLALCKKEGEKDEAVAAAVAYLLRTEGKKPRWTDPHRLDAFYQEAFALSLVGGDDARAYRKVIYEVLLAKQQKDGRWLSVSEGYHGPIFCTAMAVLVLSAEDRHLPLYRVDREKKAPSNP